MGPRNRILSFHSQAYAWPRSTLLLYALPHWGEVVGLRSTPPNHSTLTPGRPVLSLNPRTPSVWQGSHQSNSVEHFSDEANSAELPSMYQVCLFVCLLVGCLTSQQQASVSQGRICSDNFTCCHTEIEVADQTFYLTQSQYTDTGPTSTSADPITPGAWQGSHWSANFEVTGMTRPRDLPLSRRTRILVCQFLLVAQFIETLTTKSVFFWYRSQRIVHLFCKKRPPRWPSG